MQYVQRNHMNIVHAKPKLVFFQYKYDEHLPEFLLMHKRAHVKCLSEFFDLTLIDEDCDYQQICGKYEPDLALFESGVNHDTCQRLEIKNIRRCPEIPKLGFHNADGFCNARAGFLSDMDHWGIETFFALSITAAEHTPEIANNLFVWPNFVDPEIYRDYCGWKSIPILFTGNTKILYPWRKKIMKLVSEYYPSLISPHPGYSPGSSITQVMVGEHYARTINASWIVPACGTIAKEVVRKHFEIPACRACLVTEESPGLKAAGFVDMKNCVFADEHNILDKLAHLFKNQDELKAIIDAGYMMVHSHHTIKQREQILQWFTLYKELEPNQKIIQPNPFGALTVVEKSSRTENSHIISNGLHLTLLRQGDDKLWKGNYEEAEALYLKCRNYMRWMPEPKLKLALCNLYKGDAKAAISLLTEPIQFILGQYKAMDPDPVEWAYLIISLLCLGKLDGALKRAGQFPWLHHPELERARWTANVLKHGEIKAPLLKDAKAKRRWSIHQMPIREFGDWIEQVRMMLSACGQRDMGETLKKSVSGKGEAFEERSVSACDNRETSISEGAPFDERRVEKDASVFFKRRLFYRNLRLRLKRCVADALHSLERKFGYFLPYGVSEMRKDEFFHAIRKLMEGEDIKTALLVGAAKGEGSTEAFLAGALENENRPSVFCISGSEFQFGNLRKTFAHHPAVKWYVLSSTSPDSLAEELARTVRKIKVDNQISSFDSVFIDGSRVKHPSNFSGELNKELQGARFVLLDGINSCYNHGYHHDLLRDRNYLLIDHNPGLRNGYAIFKRANAATMNADNPFTEACY